MSDVMFFGVLRMPYEMAMAGEISRRQFWSRAQEAADRVERLEAELARRSTSGSDETQSVKVDERVLPPLPRAAHRGPEGTGSYFDSYTPEQMREYARTALAQQATTASASEIPPPKYPNMRVLTHGDVSECCGYTESQMRAAFARAPLPAQGGAPLFWFNPETVERSRLTDYADSIAISGTSVKFGYNTVPLYTAPAQADDARDAARYRWLNDQGAVFYTDDGKRHQVCESAMDNIIDTAMSASYGKEAACGS